MHTGRQAKASPVWQDSRGPSPSAVAVWEGHRVFLRWDGRKKGGRPGRHPPAEKLGAEESSGSLSWIAGTDLESALFYHLIEGMAVPRRIAVGRRRRRVGPKGMFSGSRKTRLGVPDMAVYSLSSSGASKARLANI